MILVAALEVIQFQRHNFIYLAGYSYESIIDGDHVITYSSYLAAGMIGFNVMISSTVAGVIIWNDKGNGMFEQILSMPITRTDYIIGNIIIMGLAGGLLILLAGAPLLYGNLLFTPQGVVYILLGLITGSIFFGSITIIFCTRVKCIITSLNRILTMKTLSDQQSSK